MTAIPVYSAGDQLAPYRSYGCKVRFFCKAGGAQLPLAYKEPTPGTPRTPSRLLQISEPQSIVAVEWWGVREGAKPQPPRIVSVGSFVLHAAAAEIDHVYREAETIDILSASGWLVLLSSQRPETMVFPAFWTPIDGRYDVTMPDEMAYYYTPEDLGIAQFLPGYSPPAAAGNKLLDRSTGGNNL